MRPTLRSITNAIILFGLFLRVSPSLQGADEIALDQLIALITSVDDSELQLDLLKGVHEALRGRKRAAQPSTWKAAYDKLRLSESLEVRRKADTLALVFQDPRARQRLKGLANNERATIDQRRWAVSTLVEHAVPDLAPTLQELLATAELRGEALKGLARYRHPRTGAKILELYKRLDAVERQYAVGALASRPADAAALVQAIRSGVVPSRDVSSFHVRQIRSFGDAKLNVALEQLWGKVGNSSEQNRKRIRQLKGRLNERTLQRGDLANGRAIFKRVCASCHRLYGEGGAIGPDLTGSNRDNLDYVLENVLDPSAAVAKDYRLTAIRTVGGQSLSGIARRRSDKVLELQTPTEKVLLSIEEIEERKLLATSMMPDGLFDKLSFEDIRDLIVYLRTKR